MQDQNLITSSTRHIEPRSRGNGRQLGFTIVELLIVIVVIGILAAITIVAYNGIQDRAHASSAQADAHDVGNLLSVANTTNGVYPSDLSTINSGGPMPTADGTTYAYHPGSGNTTYCVTVTNGKSSYKVTDTNTAPTSGGCPGDGVGGVAAITNLSVNPSVETDGTNWAGFSTQGSSTLSIMSGGAYNGNSFYRQTVTSGTGGFGGIYQYGDAVTAGHTYSASIYVKASSAKNLTLSLEWHSPTAQLSATSGPAVNVSSAWTEMTVTGTAPANATSVTMTAYVTNGSVLNSGDVLDADALMVTEGPSVYAYADGNSPSWVWNGTTNDSTSTGPPQ